MWEEIIKNYTPDGDMCRSKILKLLVYFLHAKTSSRKQCNESLEIKCIERAP